MYLTPLIRSSRAISACLIYPEHPITAIAISETISVLGPLFNLQHLSKIIATTMAIIYAPSYTYYYIKQFNQVATIYNKIEIISLWIFILYFSIF
tara:strand:+ start:180 stop:464 length:285 start_codon:yes stop_codon:yes gene_type:complete